jgi:hypothetical protein
VCARPLTVRSASEPMARSRSHGARPPSHGARPPPRSSLPEPAVTAQTGRVRPPSGGCTSSSAEQ